MGSVWGHIFPGGLFIIFGSLLYLRTLFEFSKSIKRRSPTTFNRRNWWFQFGNDNIFMLTPCPAFAFIGLIVLLIFASNFVVNEKNSVKNQQHSFMALSYAFALLGELLERFEALPPRTSTVLYMTAAITVLFLLLGHDGHTLLERTMHGFWKVELMALILFNFIAVFKPNLFIRIAYSFTLNMIGCTNIQTAIRRPWVSAERDPTNEDVKEAMKQFQIHSWIFMSWVVVYTILMSFAWVYKRRNGNSYRFQYLPKQDQESEHMEKSSRITETFSESLASV